MKTLSLLPRAVARISASLGTAAYLQYLAVSKAFAQAGFGGQTPVIPGTPAGGAGQVRNSVTTVLTFILTFLALVAVLFVIIGGIRILAAGGNEENVTKGRKTILYAIIGLIIIFFARVIVGFFTAELASQFP